GNALHDIQRRAGLHHHELPARRAVVVGLPVDAAEDRSGQEHGATSPAVEPHGARRVTETQIKIDTLLDVGERYAGERYRAGDPCGRLRHSFGHARDVAHGVFSGNSRSSNARSSSATVTPRVNAETL